MASTNLLLLFISAWATLASHIGMKKSHNRFTFLWLMLFTLSILYSPLILLIKQSIPSHLWWLILSSALFETIYFIAASAAYKHEDLSVVFPVMRGSGPLFLLLGAVIILHEYITLLGMLGIFVIVSGLLIVNLKKLSQWHTILHRFKYPGMRWALLAGFCIGAFTLIDSVGVQQIEPALYVYLVMVMTLIILTPFTLKSLHWQKIVAELKADKGVCIIAGVTTLASYTLVLFVIKQGMPAAYAGSIREMSIIFSSIIGLIFFKEKFSSLKISGAALIACGIAIIAIFGKVT